MEVDTVVLDIDGVLVDVSNSYRRAIVDSVQVVYGKTIPKARVQLFKDAGGFNNDWLVTDAVALFVLARSASLDSKLEAFTAAIEHAGGGLEGAKSVVRERLDAETAATVLDRWEPDRLRTVFQQLYLGPKAYRDLEGGEPDLYDESGRDTSIELPPDGYMANEPVLIDHDTIEALDENFELGVVTGRPRAEAKLAIDRVGLPVPPERLFAMGDWPGKPDPAGLITVTERAGGTAVAFAGDTQDDIRTATNADSNDSERRYEGIGVLTGGLSDEEGRTAFEAVGAELVLESVTELPDRLHPL
ncbi:TIGR01548 family HAD-type hydrolase [Halodesulfurarchaeum sp.]|uniref:TIGR01548 family HAD-type hydrolase n=1 Tax=Halodesulfurarchaeum sp. TaxID=1980530 RepID=UPI002FC323F0